LEFIWLNAGRKYVAFDKHRKYLKRGHRFRGDKKNFTKGKVVREEETIPKFNGETVDGELSALKPSKEPGKTYVGYGETHNWTHVPGLTQLFKCHGGKAGASKRGILTREEKDCIMFYVVTNMHEVLRFIR
jgi:hypothetical protein